MVSNTSQDQRSPSPSPHPHPHRTPSAASYLSYPVSQVMSGLYRRLTEPPAQPVSKLLNAPSNNGQDSGLYTPPRRTGSPFQPPPLTPLTLTAHHTPKDLLLSRSLAEEIRLLVPPRLQLVDSWQLVYSLERDGSSLATLYQNCEEYSGRSQRAGYVLVVRDGCSGPNGAVFGAYLTDAPHPSPHFYGTGECFLWRASILSAAPLLQAGLNNPPSEDLLELAGLPPPPSADTTHMQRTTTIRGEKKEKAADLLHPPNDAASQKSGTSTPERIRFKAFPYSGINDFMIFCEHSFLSVGGGDGHYGLWLDDTFEHGISSSCPTFGNEPLSEEGTKFDVLGVEVWYIGA